MSDPIETRLVALLREQRRIEAQRHRLPRESAGWRRANTHLDTVNRELMEAAAALEPARATDAEIDVESRPDSDPQFRASVLRCVRRAFRSPSPDRLTKRTLDRLAGAEEQMRRATEAIADAQARLRDAYPRATLTVAPGRERPNRLRVQADRDGRVA